MAYPSDLVRTKNWGTEILTDGDLEGQFDLIINWVMASLNGTNGHTHSGVDNYGKKISPASLLIASQATGDVLYASSATAWARLAIGTAYQIFATNSGATAPEWASMSHLHMPDGAIVNVAYSQDSTDKALTDSTPFPADNTKPQWGEGVEYTELATAITPKSGTNILHIRLRVKGFSGTGNASWFAMALFKDTDADALASSYMSGAITSLGGSGGTHNGVLELEYFVLAGDTSARTYKVCCSSSSGTAEINNVAGTAQYDETLISSMVITEIKAS